MKNLSRMILRALAEDNAFKDVTTLSIVPEDLIMTGILIVKQPGVVCGLDVFSRVFRLLDARCKVTARVKDGTLVKRDQIVAEIRGPGRAILSGERTALNYIQHLSGIATLTRAFTEQVKGTEADIYDTRKTIPGMRELAKYAVRCGGGKNHRIDLHEMALIKDNHLAMVRDVREAVACIRSARPDIRVEVECENYKQVDEAMAAGADIIMLDNMDAERIKQSVHRITVYAKKNNVPKPEIEVSGGINLSTVGAYARLGVTRISVGALTHSVAALDISLEIDNPIQ